MSRCTNCPYDCCCNCLRDKAYLNDETLNRCFYCDDSDYYWQPDLHIDHYERKTARKCSMSALDRYVCWDCRKIWRENYTYFDGRWYWTDTTDDKRCSSCHKKIEKVHHTCRFPKQKHIKKWKLLEKIIHADFSNSPQRSLGNFWHKNGGFGCTLHIPDNKRKKFWIPKHEREWDEWKLYMNETSYN